MKQGGKMIPAMVRGNRWLFIFLGIGVVFLVVLGIVALSIVWTDDIAPIDSEVIGIIPMDMSSDGMDDQPSVQAEDIASRNPVPSVRRVPSVQAVVSVQSVQSVQSARSVPSSQSVQPTLGAQGVTVADIDRLQLADLKARADLPEEWWNVLLLGSDSRDMSMISLADTIIIASINRVTSEVKLTSILRDTVVPIPGRGMQRINTAVYYGGPSLLMQVINTSFGMNITDYVLINFAGMAKAIDALGGIYLDINQKEMEQINRHMGEIATYTMNKADYLAKREEMRLKAWGPNALVNGIQAVSYARIRNIDSDAARAGRQRAILGRSLERIKGADAARLLAIGTQVWSDFITNIDMASGIAMAQAVLGAGESKAVAEFSIPGVGTRQTSDGALIDVDLAANTLRLHAFIYGSAIP